MGDLQFVKGVDTNRWGLLLFFFFPAIKSCLACGIKNKLPYFFLKISFLYNIIWSDSRCSCTHSVRRLKEHGGHRLKSKENTGVAKYCRIIGEIFPSITIFLTLQYR